MRFLPLVFLVLLNNTFMCAQQANYKFNIFGNRSILLAGNVTGSVTDLGLAYYNPARLTQLETTGFAINAKAYQFSSISLTNVFGESSKVSNNDFDGVPNMAGATFNLFGTRFAYTFLTKLDTNTDLNYTTNTMSNALQDVFPNHEKYSGAYNLKSQVKDEWMGLTWAEKIGEKFSFGITAFGSAYRYSEGSTLSHTVLEADNTTAFYQKLAGFTQRSYGLIFKVGANYNIKKADIGLNISLPYIEIYKEASFNYKNLISGLGPDYDVFYDYQLKELDSKRKEPLSVSLGAGIPYKQHKIHINIDYVTGISTYQRIDIPNLDLGETAPTVVHFNEERKAVVNFGLGAEINIKDNLQSFIAFSTDFNGFTTNANVFDLSNPNNKELNLGGNFMHLSFGTDWKLNWANAIFGATYTGGSGSAPSPFNPDGNPLDVTTTPDTHAKYARWQFVVGIEVPFINQKIKSLIK